MNKLLIIIATSLCSCGCNAQHCPWDCSGMIIVHTVVSKQTIDSLRPVLVDEERQAVVDTMYGTGLPTYDRCNFLYYNDFMKYRKGKITVHGWYAYDTVYHFARGNFIVKYNFCKFGQSRLFLRFDDPQLPPGNFKYVEIAASSRIHLHNYNNELRKQDSVQLKAVIQKVVIPMQCADWGLPPAKCK